MAGWATFFLKALFVLAGLVAFGGGIVSFFFYPSRAALHSHVSENALLTGQSEHSFQKVNTDVTIQLCKEHNELLEQLCSDAALSEEDRSRLMAEWIADKLTSFKLTAAIQTFSAGYNGTGYSAYGILPAPRGDGTESLVISSRYMTCKDLGMQDPIPSTAVVLGLIKHLEGRPWRHKEFVVIFADGRHDESVSAWLAEYHHPNPAATAKKERAGRYYGDFKRAGQIMAALNLKADQTYFDKIMVRPEGANGQLPNMDLLTMSVSYVRRSGLKPTLPRNYIDTLAPSSLIPYLTADMITLFNSMLTLAVGVPTGDHGVFTEYYIDAVTLQAVPEKPQYDYHRFMAISQVSQLIENSIKSLNSITERLHQSYYYYLSCSLDTFVPIGYYTPSLGLILLPLLLRGLYLYYYAARKDRQWFCSFTEYFAIFGTSVVIFLLPFGLEQYVEDRSLMVTYWLLASSVVIAGLLSVLLPLIDTTLRRKPTVKPLKKQKGEGNQEEDEAERDWTSLMALACTVLMMFLGTFSIVNFSFCVLLSLLVVPVCSVVSPSSSSILSFLQMFLVVLFSPPSLVFFVGLYLGYGYVDLWATLLSHYHQYSTLTYPFLCLAVLPHNLTTLYVLTHPPFESKRHH